MTAPAFGVRLFGVLRFVIQPLSLVLGRQPMNARPQNIEQANFEGTRVIAVALASRPKSSASEPLGSKHGGLKPTATPALPNAASDFPIP